jgi:23S rRNA pseudouridine2605 synthase
MPGSERLQRYLARAGIASRRKCEQLILEGRVMVNGKVVDVLGARVSAGDTVTCDGRTVAPEPLEYYLLNKPAGVVSAVSDGRGRRTVTDLVPSRRRLFPVGRLDRDTTGLLLLTNDGSLAHRLMHPRFQVDKVYRTEVKGVVTDGELGQLRSGIKLDDGRTAPAGVRLLARGKSGSVVELTIHEGRKRQVRRMMEALGHPVIRLHRSRYAMLTDAGISKGGYRALSDDEVAELEKLSGGR